MKLQKREYQISAERKFLRAKERCVLIVSPTASGKSVIGSAIVLATKTGRVLWIAHRVQLLLQARAELVRAGIDAADIGICCGPYKENLDARILIGSIDMMRRRDVPNGTALIVIDEAHRSEAKSYKALLAAAPKARVLGLTATPWRLDGKPLGDTYQSMIVAAQHAELIGEKFIACPITYGVPREKAREMVRGVAAGKDFATTKLGAAMSRHKILGDVVTELKKHARGVPTIVFAVNHKHGRQLAGQIIRGAKFVTEYMDQNTAQSARERMLADLASGAVHVVVCVDVLAEGIDVPAVKCICIARPTKSLTRFLQYCGRAGRWYKGQRPIILDFAGNCYRHGLPEQDREWSLTQSAKHGNGEAPVKMCPKCEAMIPMGAKVCPECGKRQPKSAQEIAEDEAKSVELERLRMSEQLRAQTMNRLLKAGYPKKWSSSVIEALG